VVPVLRYGCLWMFTVVNAADNRRHPGFERFAQGPDCSPVVGPTAVRSAHSHARAPDPGPFACTRSILPARRPQRNAGTKS
jgi:hypothetical protein